MPKYIFELAGYLFIAILFGIGVGWLIWGDEPFEVNAAGGEVDDETVNDLHAQVETRDQEIVRLRKRLKRLHADIDSQGAALTEAKTASESLQALVSQREHELAQVMDGQPLPEGSELSIRRISELEEELAASRSESSSLARRLQEHLDNPPVVTASNESDRAAIAELTESKAQLVAANEELQRSFAAVSNDLAEAQARLEEGNAAGPDLAQLDKIRVLESEIARLKSNSSEGSDRVAALETTQVDLQKLLADRDATVADLGAQLNAAQSALAAAQTGQPAEASDLQLELTKAQTELNRSRQVVSKLREESQSLEDENGTLAGDLARATAELQNRSAKHNEATAERERLIAELDALKSGSTEQVAQLQQQASKLEQQAVQAQQLSAQLKQDLAAVLARSDEAAKAQAAADQQLGSARAELDRLRSEAEASKAHVETAQSTLEKTRADHEALLSSLQQDLADARMRADGAHDALKDLSHEFVSFRDATVLQQSSMNSIADRLAKANSSLGSRPSPTTPLDNSAAADATPTDGDADR